MKSARKIFVGHCTEDITEDDLSDYFGKYGEVTDSFIPKPFRGFAFVTFNEPDVVNALTGRDHTIKDTKVFVTEAIPRSNEPPKFGGQGGFRGGFDGRRPPTNRYDNYGGGYNNSNKWGDRQNDSWSDNGYGNSGGYGANGNGGSTGGWKSGGGNSAQAPPSADPNFIASVVNQAVAGVLSNLKGSGGVGGGSGGGNEFSDRRWGSKWES